MRALLTLFCLFCASPAEAVTEGIDRGQEPKVETYRALLSEFAASDAASEELGPSDLPAALREMIDTWTDGPPG